MTIISPNSLTCLVTIIAIWSGFFVTMESSFAQQNSTIVVEKCQLTIKDRVELTSLQTGRIKQIYVTYGSQVKSGDALIKLDDEMLKLSLQVAEKQLSNPFEYQFAQKSRELALMEFDIARKLNDKIPGSRSQLELQELKLKTEHAELQQNQAYLNHELAQLKKSQLMHELDASLIKSPLDGMVVDLKKHVGEVVQAGEKFGEIINLEKLYVEGFMPANYAWNVTTGKPFQAYSTFEKPAGMTQPATIYAGTILMVHPEIDDISKTVRFVGIVKNHDNMLRSGLPMKLQIEISPNSR